MQQAGTICCVSNRGETEKTIVSEERGLKYTRTIPANYRLSHHHTVRKKIFFTFLLRKEREKEIRIEQR